MADAHLVSVLLPRLFDAPLTYAANGLALVPGMIVRVPLGSGVVYGVVWDDPPARDVPGKLKSVQSIAEGAMIPASLRRFLDWAAGYSLNPRGLMLRLALSATDAFAPPRTVAVYQAVSNAQAKTNAQIRLLHWLQTHDGWHEGPHLAKHADVSASVIKTMFRAGALLMEERTASIDLPMPDGARPGPVLSADQSNAAAAMTEAVALRQFDSILLEGVTGSGKTEAYFEAVAECLRAGRQVLVLLPEIALTAQWLGRFAERFGAPPLEWHSQLGEARRRETWRAVAGGLAGVIVGARSALFLPFKNLGLIIVDEEHDSSYKQEEGLVYNARDMAVARAKFESCPVVLASATPALETRLNAQQGRYRHLRLSQRYADAALPDIRAIDMRKEKLGAGRFISQILAQAMAERLERGEQTLLFLNRRGYAPLTLCGTCGHRLQCPNCSAWLVAHKGSGPALRCHHCGYGGPIPDVCPSCEAEDSFKPCGPGVERLADEVRALFPDARLAVMASDTTDSAQSARSLVEAMAERHLDILIGTQMAAKGYHFPHLTLVGVVDADLGLSGGDLRAAERTWQLLIQVAGRAGRDGRPGLALLQTYEPQHPVMGALAAHDAEGFYAAEAAAREKARMPPYARLGAILLSSKNPERLQAAAQAMAKFAPHLDGVAVLGPAPPPLALLRGQHRLRFLVKADRKADLARLLRDWRARVDLPGGVMLRFDIDPYSFL